MTDVLDLFSAAAGGWSLGMHRAGFSSVAACEAVAWRRALYAENNPGVVIYDDVCTLTADRIISDLGYFPAVVVGSPPCQDVSPANTKGKGVEGERSGLFFEAVRIIGEGRPRWFALENSANLRTRGADAVLAALEALGYACWAFVVRAGDVGANHERPRSWLIGCDVEQVTDARGWDERQQPRRRDGAHGSGPALHGDNDPAVYARNANGECCATGLSLAAHEGIDALRSGRLRSISDDERSVALSGARDAPDADQAGQADGCLESSLRQASQPDNGRRHVGGDDVAHTDGQGQSDRAVDAEMGWGSSFSGDASGPWADWNGGLAHHLRVDDGLSPWLASARVAVGGPRGTSAASLIVEAFGDSVVPQIPEAIGRAILRTEASLSAVFARSNQ